eukprot:6463898-Amphidinium_carterae.1
MSRDVLWDGNECWCPVLRPHWHSHHRTGNMWEGTVQRPHWHSYHQTGVGEGTVQQPPRHSHHQTGN